MRTMPLLLALGVALPVAAGGRQAAAAAGLVEAEWAFIHHCAKAGVKASFLEAFHPEGLIFRPEPANGKAWYGQRPEAKGLLSWAPAVTCTAASEDLGYNTGPWEFRTEPGAAPRAFGWFFSVWKRGPGGAWKLFWDIGVPTREAAAVPVLKATPPSIREALPGAALSEAQALELDRKFIQKAVAESAEAAYRGFLAPEGRLFRSPAQPAAGWTAAQTLLAGSPGTRTWEPRDAAVARSGELLFIQGAYTRAREGKSTESGTYIRVWRRLGPAWTLELDLESPQPGA